MATCDDRIDATAGRAVVPADADRTFRRLLVNTLVSGVTSSFLWFALTFWVYLETRSVVATGVIGGAFSISSAILGPAFGTYVDRHRKHAVDGARHGDRRRVVLRRRHRGVPRRRRRRPAAAAQPAGSGCWSGSRCSARWPARCAASRCRRA